MLKLWTCVFGEDGRLDFKVKSELLFGRNLQEVTELKTLGENDLLLLTGGYDSKIHVYITKKGALPSELTFQFSMAGHFNSIKSLHFSPTLEKNACYLVSGSQDNNIRIWLLQPMQNLASK